MWNPLTKIAVVGLLCVSPVFAQEQITSFDNTTLPVINNELQKLQKDIRNLENTTSYLQNNPPTYNVTSFGAWVDKSADYGAQVATTDGIVVASGQGVAPAGVMVAYSDINADPSTVVGEADMVTNYYGGMTFPVNKGNSWKIVFSDGGCSNKKIWWIPLGT